MNGVQTSIILLIIFGLIATNIAVFFYYQDGKDPFSDNTTTTVLLATHEDPHVNNTIIMENATGNETLLDTQFYGVLIRQKGDSPQAALRQVAQTQQLTASYMKGAKDAEPIPPYVYQFLELQRQNTIKAIDASQSSGVLKRVLRHQTNKTLAFQGSNLGSCDQGGCDVCAFCGWGDCCVCEKCGNGANCEPPCNGGDCSVIGISECDICTSGIGTIIVEACKQGGSIAAGTALEDLCADAGFDFEALCVLSVEVGFDQVLGAICDAVAAAPEDDLPELCSTALNCTCPSS